MIRYFSQWARNQFFGPVLPLELILFVTGRCTFRCKHCFIKQFDTDPSTDLPLETIELLAADLPDLLVLMLTGGEPFMRDDLAELVRIFSISSSPKVISIATNGLLVDKICAEVNRIVTMPEFRSQLLVTLSFEGTRHAHDSNRGFAGAYGHAMETARQLKRLQARYKSLAVGANITLLPGNDKSILPAARELADAKLFSFLSQNIYRENRPCRTSGNINVNVYRELSEFVYQYSRDFNMGGGEFLGRWYRAKERYQAKLIENMCRNGTYQGVPCEAGRGIGVVYWDGRVAPCEVLSADWGNIKEKSFARIWNNPVSREMSNRLRVAKCFCTHECFTSASLNMRIRSMFSCLASQFSKDRQWK